MRMAGSLSLEIAGRWMKEKGLCLAKEKTQAVILSGRQKLQQIEFTIGEVTVRPVQTALGERDGPMA